MKFGALVNATDAGTGTTDLGAVGHQDNRFLIAEYPASGTDTCCVVYNKTTGKFYASTLAGPGAPPQPYTMGNTSGAHTGAALFFALLPEFSKDPEFAESFAEFREEQKRGFSDLERATNAAYLLCDHMYRRIENHTSLGTDGMKVTIPASMNITQLNQAALNNHTYSPTAAVYGDFVIMDMGVAPSAPAINIDHSSFVGHYPISSRTLSAAEQSMVPVLPDWYVIPKEAKTACEHISVTTGSHRPIRNLMLRGPAGTGKTMCSRAIAAGLSRPYMFYTCSANTETADIMGQIMPETEYAQQNGMLLKDMEFPTVEDIVMDPATAYCNMTGKYVEGITEDEVLSAMVELAAVKKTEKAEGGGQKFYFVETPLITALREGYVIEIQEPTVIANPGVLSCLNSLMDDSKAVILPTGQKLERHPEAVVVVTTNVNYNGCRDMNQAFISRMNLLMDMDEPDIDTTTKRVLNITGCTDTATVRSMAEVVNNIHQHCRELMITDGACGVRELIGWVQSYMITSNPYPYAEIHAVVVYQVSAIPSVPTYPYLQPWSCAG